eukprot:scaffold9532_cov74-Phaeocystis_antarctica.AAC.3
MYQIPSCACRSSSRISGLLLIASVATWIARSLRIVAGAAARCRVIALALVVSPRPAGVALRPPFLVGRWGRWQWPRCGPWQACTLVKKLTPAGSPPQGVTRIPPVLDNLLGRHTPSSHRGGKRGGTPALLCSRPPHH